MARKNSGSVLEQMTAHNAQGLSLVENRLAEIETMLDRNQEGSLYHVYDTGLDEIDASVQPQVDELVAELDRGVAAARLERSSLRRQLRVLVGPSTPAKRSKGKGKGGKSKSSSSGNARTQNAISQTEAVCAAMVQIDGDCGPATIVEQFATIGYSTSSASPQVQVSQRLAGLVESGIVKKVSRGVYRLNKRGTNMGTEALATIANPPSEDDS